MKLKAEKMYEDDYFKSLGEMLSPDSRNTMFVSCNTNEPITLEWFHDQILRIQLSENVFGEIKVQFETAKNVLLYSWYSYRLGMVAWSQANACLELTLRIAAETQGFKVNKLRRLLEKANKENWIDFNEFIKTNTAEEYIKIICDFRNSLSHGTNTLIPPLEVLPFLYDFSIMINQMFDKELLTNKGKSIRDGWE